MTKRPSKPSKQAPGPELRLRMELIPEPLWGQNLRTELGKTKWRRLRDALAARRKPGCAVCDSRAPLQGHEVWDYAETKTAGIATLQDINLICQDCSSIHHFGRFHLLFAQSKPQEYERVIKHALRVNGCDMATWEQHGREAKAAYDRRSKLSWTVDYGWLGELVQEAADEAADKGRKRIDYDLFLESREPDSPETYCVDDDWLYFGAPSPNLGSPAGRGFSLCPSRWRAGYAIGFKQCYRHFLADRTMRALLVT